MYPLPTTEPEIDAFLAAFENCTLPKSRWTHSAHLFTGACYVHAHGLALATDYMRERIRRYYDYDLAASTEARMSWVPPNLRDFD